jgi:hypothetical protein
MTALLSCFMGPPQVDDELEPAGEKSAGAAGGGSGEEAGAPSRKRGAESQDVAVDNGGGRISGGGSTAGQGQGDVAVEGEAGAPAAEQAVAARKRNRRMFGALLGTLQRFR